MIPKLLSKINLNEKAAINPDVIQGIINNAIKICFPLVIWFSREEIRRPIKNWNATDPPTNIIEILIEVRKLGSFRTCI